MNHTMMTTPIHRRALLQTLALSATSFGAMGTAFGQSSASTIEVWRALSRVGYGPTESLVRAVQAARSPRAWALQQIDIALAASQTAPRISADMAHFNAPLPRIFEGAKAERDARAKLKAGAGDSKPGELQPRDDKASAAPEHFSRTMTLQTAAWRLTSASQPEQENPLLARMTEFWFNHLNVYVGKGAVRPFTGHYVVNVARAHALGKFEDLLLASARHPAMLLYLDQARRGFNENYARELMELHTLGVDGGYGQADVRELARVLTGWTVDPNAASGFQFVRRLHDSKSKQVMGSSFPASLFRSGEPEGEDAIRMLARHPATAKRISLRLAQFFVSDAPTPALVKVLSDTFLATQGDIAVVLRALLQSADFWAAGNRLFKTPMDFACSALAATHADEPPNRRTLALALDFLSNAGQPLHGWQTPDGYKFDAATWLVPEALTRRADFALTLARQTPELAFLQPFLGEATQNAVAQERPALRAGLVLASPDFMYK